MTSKYGDIYADIYDSLFSERDDLDIVTIRLAQLAKGGAVLEFGIGTGRIAIPLALCGVAVTGIDISSAMLDKLAQKPEASPIKTYLGDCTQDRVEGDFSLVYMVFSTLFLIDGQDDQVRCFHNAARHLPIGGTFIVEGFVHDRTRFLHNQEVTTTKIADNAVTIRAANLNPFTQEITMQTIQISPQGIQMLPNTLHFVYPLQMDLMGRLAGFRLCERWSSWSGAPFTPDSTNQIAIYEKVADHAI